MYSQTEIKSEREAIKENLPHKLRRSSNYNRSLSGANPVNKFKKLSDNDQRSLFFFSCKCKNNNFFPILFPGGRDGDGTIRYEEGDWL